jgi:hypothetical protein
MTLSANFRRTRLFCNPLGRRRKLLFWASLTFFFFTGLQSAIAGSQRFCDKPIATTAAQQDKLLRFSEVIKHELDQSGASIAIISRSGLDLDRFGVRYSHAGFSLKNSTNSPWSIRQLYFACDEGRSKIFDQGMAGFVQGTDDLDVGYISVVILPNEGSDRIAQLALSNQQSLHLLNPNYSAIAYGLGLQYQNCNQWVIEMIASALCCNADDALALVGRSQALDWLRQQSYQPEVINVGSRFLMWIAPFVPLIALDDHPAEDVSLRRLHISMPTAIERFLLAKLAQSQRIQFCHNQHQIVIRRSGPELAQGCVADASDQVIAID